MKISPKRWLFLNILTFGGVGPIFSQNQKIQVLQKLNSNILPSWGIDVYIVSAYFEISVSRKHSAVQNLSGLPFIFSSRDACEFWSDSVASLRYFRDIAKQLCDYANVLRCIIKTGLKLYGRCCNFGIKHRKLDNRRRRN